jgi:hypothetical protein
MLVKELRATLASTAGGKETLIETIKQLEEQVSSLVENNATADVSSEM